MRLRKLQSSGDLLWGLSYCSMYFDAVSSEENVSSRDNSELGYLCDFLRSKYLHSKETTYPLNNSAQNKEGQDKEQHEKNSLSGISLSCRVIAFADYDFKEEDEYWKSEASYDRDSCQIFGDYLRTHFPRKASLTFVPTNDFHDLSGIRFVGKVPAEYSDAPNFDAGVLQITFIKSPDVVREFGFITAYETPRHKEIFMEILQGGRAGYDGNALLEYRKSISQQTGK
ncbi:hypothetical protein HYX13_01180 [Candidatus Woesearchaeota archaeon]|nr:hypothetical protein [Candidatus Woesearchaeota archaeon]